MTNNYFKVTINRLRSETFTFDDTDPKAAESAYIRATAYAQRHVTARRLPISILRALKQFNVPQIGAGIGSIEMR